MRACVKNGFLIFEDDSDLSDVHSTTLTLTLIPNPNPPNPNPNPNILLNAKSGLETEWVSAADVAKMHPLVDAKDIDCALYTPR